MEKRKEWSGQLGFLLAAAGSAIGLGNLWKFPYLMGKNGGFPFLVAYIIFIIILGVPMLIVEMSIGRETKAGPVGAFKKLNPKTVIIGVLSVLTAYIIISYYTLIGGWIVKFFVSYVTTAAAPSFGEFIAKPVEPMIWTGVFLIATLVLCIKGAESIEKASKFMMPILFVIMFVMVIRSVTLPGAMEGVKFMFMPSESPFTISSISAALGQVFFSLSIGMGILVTYGSYLGNKEDIPKNSYIIAGLDTCAALLGGLIILPAVFAFNLEPTAGPTLLFDTLPRVFESMPLGFVFAGLFFLFVLFAGLTSSIALLECVAAFVIEELKLSRVKALVLAGIFSLVISIPCSLSFGALADVRILNFGIFDFMCMLTDNIFMPLAGLCMCIYAGWFWAPKKMFAAIEKEGVVFKLKKVWLWFVRYVVPVCILGVCIPGFISVFNTIAA